MADETIQSLISEGAEARAAVMDASAALVSDASGIGVTGSAADFAASAQALAAALLDACANPADAVRLLLQLSDFMPSSPSSSSPIGRAVTGIETATGALFRRAALVALAQASAAYQPTSYDDAATLRETIVEALEQEIIVAGDSDDDDTYTALRALQRAVIQDLNSRGANLARVKSYEMRAAMPSLALAQLLYQDAGRRDELVTQANPRHPAFMPPRFRALSA